MCISCMCICRCAGVQVTEITIEFTFNLNFQMDDYDQQLDGEVVLNECVQPEPIIRMIMISVFTTHTQSIDTLE